jgi:PKD repeat protein
VVNLNPVANAGPDITIDEGLSIPLTGSATDPGSADGLTYAWDFDFNGTFSEPPDATGPSATIPPLNGDMSVTVALRVQDDDYPYPIGSGGEIGEHIDTLTVTVNNVPPTVEAGGPYAGVEDQPVTLSGSASDAPGETLIYEWDLNYDGTFDNPVSGQTISNIWDTGGNYTVALRVTDDEGEVGLDIATVVIDFIPTADAGGPYSGNEGASITFSGSASDPDIGDTLTYIWNFGDGSPVVSGVNLASVPYTYADNGSYTVTLRVEDGRGGVATATAAVTVVNLNPVANAGGPYATTTGAPVTLTGSGTDVPGDTLTFNWDLNNDGSFETPGQSVDFTSPTSGTFTVNLQVSDGDGGIATDTTTVQVNSILPMAWPGVVYFILHKRKRRKDIMWREL